MSEEKSLFHTTFEWINGFERFDDRRLPQWLRDRLIDSDQDPNLVSDEWLIDQIAAFGLREWLQGVGAAVIHGEEYLLLHCDFVDEPMWFASCYGCGVGYPARAHWQQPQNDHVVCLSPTPVVTMCTPEKLACVAQSH